MIGAVRRHLGEEAPDPRLAGVLRRERGVVHRSALVEVAVDVARIDPGVAQLQEVEQHAVLLVDGRGARVDRDLGVRLDGGHHVRREHVRGQQVVEDAVGVREGHAASGGVGALHPAHQHHDVGLVDRHPAPAVRRQRGHDTADVTGEDVGRAGPEPELLAQPPGVGEVVQRDDGLHASVGARREDPGVALERGRVEGIGPGLEAGPLDREPERIGAGGRGPVQCLFGMTPEVAGQTGPRRPSTVLPARPVVVGLARPVEPALNLVARRRHAGEKALPEQAGSLPLRCGRPRPGP